MSLLLALIARLDPPPEPENGPSGGANWLSGYKPKYDYSQKRRRNKRDELLFITA